MKRYRPPGMPTFRFPFRIGGRTLASGSYNQPTKPGGKMPAIKQFSAVKPGRPKPRQK